MYPERPLDTLVDIIAQINEVHHKYTGFVGGISGQYYLFDELKTRASIEELLELTAHPSGVVACYAGWGLIDRDFSHIDSILESFFVRADTINTLSGCSGGFDPIASVFYRRYLGRLISRAEHKVLTVKIDSMLILLDSMIIHQRSAPFLLDEVIQHRQYPITFLPQIEALAFRNRRLAYLSYLHTYHPKGREDRIKQSVWNNLRDDWRDENVYHSEFLIMTDILLSYKDENLTQYVLEIGTKLANNAPALFLVKYERILDKYGLPHWQSKA